MSLNQTETIKFLNYLSNPNALSNNDLADIQDWISKYPYSQSLRFLATKAAQGTSAYPNLLIDAATIAPNRATLHAFIHQPQQFESTVLAFADATPIIENETKNHPEVALSDHPFGININEIFGSEFKSNHTVETPQENPIALKPEVKDLAFAYEKDLQEESNFNVPETTTHTEEEISAIATHEEEINVDELAEIQPLEIDEKTPLVNENEASEEENIGEDNNLNEENLHQSLSTEETVPELPVETEEELQNPAIEPALIMDEEIAPTPEEAFAEEEIEEIGADAKEAEDFTKQEENITPTTAKIENIEKENFAAIAEEEEIEEISEEEVIHLQPEPENVVEETGAMQVETIDKEEDILVVTKNEAEQPSAIEAKAVSTVEKEELVFDHPAPTNFFEINKEELKPVVESETKNLEESISQYNDERMPYTFLWWLNKTRKQHAGNLQPYSTFKLDTSKQIKKAEVDHLNHQIAENIFHLRGVEDLSSSGVNYTVPFDFRKKEFQIIEKFIKEEPQIKPPAANKIDSENKAKKSSEDTNEVVSETLAKIYVEQMLYHKALDVYKKLSLKFPEKSTYFASQIKYLELKVN